MDCIIEIICAPGSKRAIEGTAPTQSIKEDNDIHYKPSVKDKLLDRWLDIVVEFSGSEFMYFLIMAGLFSWAFMGIKFGTTNLWQILISDIQAIVSYIFDSLLMRQQQNNYYKNLEVAACLQSRHISIKRMLKEILESGKYKYDNSSLEKNNFKEEKIELSIELPPENWYGKLSTGISIVLGHIFTVFIFWVGIIIWLGFGPSMSWSNDWQLYMNSASSALMVLLFSFLANIRERHGRYQHICIDAIYQADSLLELKLRTLTGDIIPNEPVIIPKLKVNKIQRAIDYYADLIGTLVGIAILLAVLITWVVIGPVMSFSSNWWLLIGTYSGLIGMNDGFVLRNIYHVLRTHEDVQFNQVKMDDLDLLTVINKPNPNNGKIVPNTLSTRISLAVGKFCSHELVVLTGTSIMIGLIIISSAMGWSLTGQLISNVPPSIIESFFMMILITGHNDVEIKKRIDLNNIYSNRLALISYIDSLQYNGNN